MQLLVPTWWRAAPLWKVVMRYLIGFVFALALVAAPQSVNAQDPEERTSPEPNVEEPALQLELDEAGVDLAPRTPRTYSGYTLEELELRKRRAAFGLIAPAALVVAGVPLLVRGTTGDCAQSAFGTPERCDGLRVSGIALTVPGSVGMVAASILVGVRKAELNLAVRDYTLEEAKRRVKPARIGLISTVSAMAVGGAFVAIAVAHRDCGIWSSGAPQWCGGVGSTGMALMIGGAAGVIATGSLLGGRKRALRGLQQAHHGTPRRVQWDLARSRLVF